MKETILKSTISLSRSFIFGLFEGGNGGGGREGLGFCCCCFLQCIQDGRDEMRWDGRNDCRGEKEERKEGDGSGGGLVPSTSSDFFIFSVDMFILLCATCSLQAPVVL